MKTLFYATLALLTVAAGTLITASAQAEFVVDEEGSNLVITYENGTLTQNYDEFDFVSQNGVDLEVTENNGRVLLISHDSEVSIEGSQSAEFDFPAGDIIIDIRGFVYSPNASHTVHIHGLRMFDVSDDLKVRVDGRVILQDVWTFHNSHSSLFVEAEELFAYSCYAIDDIELRGYYNSPSNIIANACYTNGSLVVESKRRRTNVTLENNYINDDLRVSLSPYDDTLDIKKFIQVNDKTDFDLGSGRDTIDIDIHRQHVDASTLGDSFAEGGWQTDTIYQNVDFFIKNVNTHGVEWIK